MEIAQTDSDPLHDFIKTEILKKKEFQKTSYY